MEGSISAVSYFLRFGINSLVSEFFSNAQIKKTYAIKINSLTATNLNKKNFYEPLRKRGCRRPKTL